MNRFMVMAVAVMMLVPGGAARAADTLAEDEAAIAKYIQVLHDPSNEVRESTAKVLRESLAKYGNRTSNIREAVLMLLAAGGTARAEDSLAEDEAAIAKHILKLYDPSNKVRAIAAKALREIVAKHGTGTSNIREKDSGEARWMEKIRQVKLGMTKAEVRKPLPPLSPKRPDFYGYASAQSSFMGWRLDLHWVVEMWYDAPDKLATLPKLIKKEFTALRAPPPHYTGKWNDWDVNGQMARELDFKDGRFVE